MRKRMPKKLFSCCACCGGGATHPDEDSGDELEARQATSYAPFPRPPALSISATPSSTQPATDMDRSRVAAAESGSTPSIASVTERASAALLAPTSRRPHAPAGGPPYDHHHGKNCSSQCLMLESLFTLFKKKLFFFKSNYWEKLQYIVYFSIVHYYIL